MRRRSSSWNGVRGTRYLPHPAKARGAEDCAILVMFRIPEVCSTADSSNSYKTWKFQRSRWSCDVFAPIWWIDQTASFFQQQEYSHSHAREG